MFKYMLPHFLNLKRLQQFKNNVIGNTAYLGQFLICNTPLVYTIYNKTFNLQIFIFSYVGCGLLQGFINSILYYVSDIYFFGKRIDETSSEWKSSPFYNLVIYNTDASFLYLIGSGCYTSLTVIPEPFRWTLTYPGFTTCVIQFVLLFLLHDVSFTFLHYVFHKTPSLRISHLKLHHDCPFHIGNSRCAIATEGLLSELYSIIFVTYFLHFYGYLWILYYSIYSFWNMYMHTGLNKYHKLHHSEKTTRNYGLYYITDYLIGTLDLNDKKIKINKNKKIK